MQWWWFILLCFVAFLVLVSRRRRSKKSDIVIVTSHWQEDLTWLQKQKTFNVVLIDHEGAAPSVIEPTAVIPNKGREAASYLKYIVDTYDRLPEYVAFIHGHEHAWHHMFQGSLLDRIKKAEYLPLNGYWTDTDTQHPEKIEKHWNVIEPWVGPRPTFNGYTDGGAQFVVSRRRIQKHPKEAYEHWYNTIVTSDDSYNMGVMFEFAWHYIMGEPWYLKTTNGV